MNMSRILDSYHVTRNFTYGEFKCPHCGANRTSTILIDKLQEARDYSNRVGSGITYRINSGFRCPTHNAAVGGASGSAHMDGLAADIHIAGDHHRMCLIYGLVMAGFTRIGDYRSWFHVDLKDSGITMWRE